MTLRQQLLRSLTANGHKPRLVASNPVTDAMDSLMAQQEHRHAWLLERGPLASKLIQDSMNDPKGDAA